MKKLCITGEDLFTALFNSPLHHVGVTSSSFSIEIDSIDEEGRLQKGKLILYGIKTLHPSLSKTLLSFHGMITLEGKEPLFFNGTYDKDENYEDCYLLVVEPEIFESNISKEEFIGLVKKYCDSRNIPTGEDGNVLAEGFPFFQNIPKDASAPSQALHDRKRKDMEVYTIMCDDYFPIVYSKGKKTVSCFGKFITSNLIKVFSKEEIRLFRKRPLFA